LVNMQITYNVLAAMCGRSTPPGVSNNEHKKQTMSHGCSRSLTVFQPTLPPYYNNSVCQYKPGRLRVTTRSVQYFLIAILLRLSNQSAVFSVLLMCTYCIVLRIYKYLVVARYKYAYEGLLDELMAKYIKNFN
jgi:hypothetical protein